MQRLSFNACAGLLFAIGASLLAVACTPAAARTERIAMDRRQGWKEKYTRPATIPFPKDNRFTRARELLGRTLFFDPRLAGSRRMACATCHNPALGWGDGRSKALGHASTELPRRTPTILNLAWADLLFWDGRAGWLEEQALLPIASPNEMNQPLQELGALLGSISEYGPLFARAYPGESIGPKTVAKALATFERTVVSGQAPFDAWVAGDEDAIPEDAKRGFDLFNSKAACGKCHTGWNFTDSGFHDIGLDDADLGRWAHLHLESMRHAFKTPTLRSADRRSPYMHDGSQASLVSVIEFYNAGGSKTRPSPDPDIKPLHLTSQEKADLAAFLKTLTSRNQPVLIPELPR